MADEKDYWMPGDTTYVTYGIGYQVSESLRTVCVGKISEVEQRQNTANSQQNNQEVVTKINSNSKLLNNINDSVIMLQKRSRGRPKKQGKVSRMTEWRRKKAAEQGTLF